MSACTTCGEASCDCTSSPDDTIPVPPPSSCLSTLPSPPPDESGVLWAGPRAGMALPEGLSEDTIFALDAEALDE